ncbi:MAG: DUF1571 domain-containing protein, partial [Planctomycetota bacterium]
MFPVKFTAATCLACALLAPSAVGQPVTKPVYRVANESAAAPQAQPAPPAAAPPRQPIVDAQVTPAATNQTPGLEGSPFDLQQRPGEHPLMPCLRLAKQGLAEMDQKIAGYSATLTKRERIGGKVEGPQQMAIKVRHKPFGVHMKFIQPFAGREVLYNSSRPDGKLV